MYSPELHRNCKDHGNKSTEKLFKTAKLGEKVQIPALLVQLLLSVFGKVLYKVPWNKFMK